jgi:hypothetical protein
MSRLSTLVMGGRRIEKWLCRWIDGRLRVWAFICDGVGDKMNALSVSSVIVQRMLAAVLRSTAAASDFTSCSHDWLCPTRPWVLRRVLFITRAETLQPIITALHTIGRM